MKPQEQLDGSTQQNVYYGHILRELSYLVAASLNTQFNPNGASRVQQ